MGAVFLTSSIMIRFACISTHDNTEFANVSLFFANFLYFLFGELSSISSGFWTPFRLPFSH
jgi:hypothetical protein